MAHLLDIPPLATPQEAKRVWESQCCPSARSVAKALTQAGRPVHFTTVARWRRQGWPTVTSPEHPLERALRAVDAASSVLTLDPTLSTRDWIRREGGTEELTRISDDQLLARAVRQTSIASILLMEEFARRSDLIVGKPKEMAAVLEAVAVAVRACAEATGQVHRLRGASTENEARRSQGTEMPSPSSWDQK